MQVMCVNNEGFEDSLTEDKIYEVVDIHSCSVEVQNDNGDNNTYNVRHFIIVNDRPRYKIIHCIKGIDGYGLTKGNEYKAIESAFVDHWHFINDRGDSCNAPKSHFIESTQKPTTLFTLPDGETVPIPETLRPLNGDCIVFKGVKYQIVSLTHDVDQGVKIYKMEIVKCK